MDDPGLFLQWLADRLIYRYGESPNVDFVHTLREIAAKLSRETKKIERRRRVSKGRARKRRKVKGPK
jgi:hypothetical protein